MVGALLGEATVSSWLRGSFFAGLTLRPVLPATDCARGFLFPVDCFDLGTETATARR